MQVSGSVRRAKWGHKGSAVEQR